jgi:uncharacterized protein (DUF1330 family)
MKSRTSIMLTLLAGAVVGGVAVQTLHAQVKPPAYVVVENEISNREDYLKEYVPAAFKAITSNGGKFVARGGNTVAIEGEPPKSRALVVMFDTLEKAQAAFATDAYKEARAVGDKYAKFRIWAVEGVQP